ncbi:hypothetical protein COV18_06615 [Candidatus Woesearchaeota archaeon CG10_big_fil_rev_8_21_14_0_10_37_12]|nr:MAG: hypothetical protein COV18_06615 [Candidatus Woesearchaeota archaeon CG10_big_fil_rev_8_21_14_0_10_37_12]
MNELLHILESCKDALVNHNNFNLSEVLTSEYFETCPNWFKDSPITKMIYHSLKERDAKKLLAGIDAEIERVETEKVKLMREEIVKYQI